MALSALSRGLLTSLPPRPVTPSNLSLQGNIYATLPKSLKAELLVSSVVEDPLLAAERMQLTSSKSVSELSQIRSLADFPLPENIERLMSRAATNTGEQTDRSVPSGRRGTGPRTAQAETGPRLGKDRTGPWLGKDTTGPRPGQARTSPRTGQHTTEIEDRLAVLESRVARLERGYVGRAVRFHEED